MARSKDTRPEPTPARIASLHPMALVIAAGLLQGGVEVWTRNTSASYAFGLPLLFVDLPRRMRYVAAFIYACLVAAAEIIIHRSWAGIDGVRLIATVMAIVTFCEIGIRFRKPSVLRRDAGTRQEGIDAPSLRERPLHEHTHHLSPSESRYRSIFEQSHVGLVELDIPIGDNPASHVPDRHAGKTAIRIVDANEAALLILQVDNVECLRNETSGLWSTIFAAIAQQYAVLTTERKSFEQQFRGIDSRGETTSIRALASLPCTNEDVSLIVLALIDTSEQERAQQQLMTMREHLACAARLTTLGTVSASITHELMQPLTSVVMDSQTCVRWLSKTPPDISAAILAAQRVAANGHRASDILSRTRDKIVSGRKGVEPVELSSLIRETSDLLGREFEIRGARHLLSIPKGDVIVQASRIELQQVLVNLIMNALQAFEHSNDIPRVDIVMETNPLEVRVAVRDYGAGLPAHFQEKIFTPFFTTKDDGIGLGLAICRSIIEEFGGHLDAENASPGARFSFTLPLLERPIADS